jgi:hypothetical protein
MPINRNGSEINQTIGYSTIASNASGQQITSNNNQPMKASMGGPLHDATYGVTVARHAVAGNSGPRPKPKCIGACLPVA